MGKKYSRRQIFGKTIGVLAGGTAMGNGMWENASNAAENSDEKTIVNSIGYSTETWVEKSANFPIFSSSFSLDGNIAKFYLTPRGEFCKPLKIMVITDTHLFLDDERGEPFLEYSQRMAKAYNVTQHWKTGEKTTPQHCFEETLHIAVQQEVDAIVLTGDMVSFPSQAGVDYMVQQLTQTGIPFYYISGNHDWHYEGMEGTEVALRAEWAPKHLAPLYQEHDPLGYSITLHGIRLLLIDDSITEIVPEQLDLLRKELAFGDPTLLFMHIPLYAPGRSSGYGCGHPEWNAKSDGNWQVERRPQWPENGHSEITFSFRKEALTAQNLLGVFAGRIHVPTLDIVAGKPLVTMGANLNGAFQMVEIIPQDR